MMNEITNLNKSYGEMLRDYFSEASPAYIIAPFINTDTLRNVIPSGVEAVIVTSWRADHLLAGFSSLELFKLCEDNNWTLFVNNRLHAKIFSSSLENCYLGSANVTNSALFQDSGNIECLAYIDNMGPMGRIELNRLISSSTLVDERVYLQYTKWFERLDGKVDVNTIVGPDIDDISPFYTSQLPATDNPHLLRRCFQNYDYFDLASEHDLAIYGMLNLESSQESFIEKLSLNFFNHPFIKLFEQRVKDRPIFFGEAKEWVQNNCVNVPLPHRRELTDLVHNLFNWFITLDPDHYEVSIPGRHSECLIYNS